MKNIIKSVICFALLAVMLFSFSACGKEHFGEFSYNGKWLTQYAKKALNAGEIKKLLQSLAEYTTDADESDVVTLSYVSDAFNSVGTDYPMPTEEMVASITNKYGTVIAYTRYYEEGKNKETVKQDNFTGGALTAILKANEVSPFTQVTAKNLILFDEIIDYMEAANASFLPHKNDTPLSNIYTYHKDNKGNPVIQIHDYAEVPSAAAGGVGSYYRQDIEMVYDEEGKLIKWQSSLGIYTATSSGTEKQGYILEVDFEWIEREAQ